MAEVGPACSPGKRSPASCAATLARLRQSREVQELSLAVLRECSPYCKCLRVSAIRSIPWAASRAPYQPRFQARVFHVSRSEQGRTRRGRHHPGRSSGTWTQARTRDANTGSSVCESIDLPARSSTGQKRLRIDPSPAFAGPVSAASFRPMTLCLRSASVLFTIDSNRGRCDSDALRGQSPRSGTSSRGTSMSRSDKGRCIGRHSRQSALLLP